MFWAFVEFFMHPFWTWFLISLCYIPWIGMACVILYGVGRLLLAPLAAR